jgi:hypothetical protein
MALDCVGVVIIAARAAGMRSPAAPAYAMGGDHEADIDEVLAACGCTRIE